MSTTTVTRVSQTNGNQTANPSNDGRGGFRGRGRGRGGRGRGRGGSRFNHSSSRIGDDNTKDSGSNAAQIQARENAPKPRLTHFLALPLGHHADLRDRMSAFARSLLDSTPAIPGLDESIVIPARRLHLTLGVMSLEESASAQTGASSQITESSSGQVTRPRTLESAIALLRELRPRILELLSDAQLLVALHRVDIMRPDRGDLEKAHVMWAGPSHDNDDAQRLKRVSEFINREFRKAGLVVDEKRPLKLHCTVLNTVYRKPRGKRLPFSYAALLASSAFRSIEVVERTATNAGSVVVESTVDGSAKRGKKPIAVDLGKWVVDEVQICQMGSWGPEGEYVYVGRIVLNK